MSVTRTLHPVERALATFPRIPRDGVVMVAVSGGADSMALVEALRTDVETRVRSSLMVAHFDHQLRPDSAHDAERVAAYAREHGLGFAHGAEDVPRRARAHRQSIEEAARNARYEFFEGVASSMNAACVVTAHTRTDQVETILMRILRGTGRVGLAGIPERRDRYVRPLLEVTRAQTRDYCLTRDVTFVDDPSNDDVRFLRNRIRHQVLPELRTLFPSIDESLLRLAANARREQGAFAARTVGWPEEHVHEESPGVWTLRIAGFTEFDDDDACALLRDALARAGCARDVGRVHYRALLKLARARRAGGAVDIPGFSARREHDAVVLQRHDRDGCAPFAVALAVPGTTRAGDWNIDVSLVPAQSALSELMGAKGREPNVTFFDVADFPLPLVARSVRTGDSMRPFGLGGSKKLSDLFVDRKIPRRRREGALVIEGGSILWVPGVARSNEGRIGSSTSYVVRIEASREDQLR